jgi:radical SAM superfamily enzyme YgiQ (UPF0313 family)
MAKIILVNPSLSGKERYGELASGGVYMPPLGLASLAAFLRKHRRSVEILDCCALNLSLEASAEAVISSSAAYVGITAATVAIHKAAELAGILKQQKPGLKIIVGGSHMSALPMETMQAFPQFDIGVIGEGELTLLELVRALDGNSPLPEIQGLIFRDAGGIKMNEARPLIKNLDELPYPAWDLLPDLTRFYKPSSFGFKKLPVASLITLRGCPMRCTFCSETPFAKTCRMHSPEYVIDMIKCLQHSYGIKDLMIYDGIFGVTPQRLSALCELMIKEQLHVVWSCNSRIDSMTQDMLKLMKRAGCWSIAYGIESGSQQVLDFIQKDIDLKKASSVLGWTRKEGILAKGYFMIGHLIESRETIRSTLEFVLHNNLDLLTLNYFTPLPGTLDYQRAAGYGAFNNEWSLLNHHNPVFIPRGLDAETICFFRKYIVRKFYLRPKIMFRYIKMFFSPGSFKIIFLGFLAFVKFAFFNRSDTCLNRKARV